MLFYGSDIHKGKGKGKEEGRKEEAKKEQKKKLIFFFHFYPFFVEISELLLEVKPPSEVSECSLRGGLGNEVLGRTAAPVAQRHLHLDGQKPGDPEEPPDLRAARVLNEREVVVTDKYNQ